jgi:predicted hydrocarbon binding protein
VQQPDSVHLPKIEDFYDLSFESGEIHLRGVKGRAFILPTKAWATVRKSLSYMLKDDAITIMSHMGYAVGMSFVEQTTKLEGKPKKLLTILLWIAKTSGWGNFSIEGDVDNCTEVSVIAKNCSFCHNEASTESPVCYFLLGFVNALVDYLYGKPHTATETRCAGMGGDICEIKIRELHPATGGKTRLDGNRA